MKQKKQKYVRIVKWKTNKVDLGYTFKKKQEKNGKMCDLDRIKYTHTQIFKMREIKLRLCFKLIKIKMKFNKKKL